MGVDDRPLTLRVFVRGELEIAVRRSNGGYRLRDGTVLRWLVW